MDSTLKELSDRLGVSPSTISRALSGRALKRPSTRARAEQIKSLATELGYAPNSLARSLKTSRRQVVGFIVPDIMNDYYATAATLVQATLASERYRMILCVTEDDPAVEAAHRRVLREERAAGIVVVPSPQPSRGGGYDPHTSDTSTPVIELVRKSGARAADAVLIDDVDAGYQGAQHLIELGHRRIAVLTGPPSLSTSRQRLAGYRKALDTAGIAEDDALICSGPYRREAACAATLQLLSTERRPTAVIATSNELVVGALQALSRLGVQVPADVSVVGFGNPDWFALLCPALTTVALPIEEMAMVAVHLLLKRIRRAEASEGNAESESAPVISRYQAHLIVRGSTRILGSP